MTNRELCTHIINTGNCDALSCDGKRGINKNLPCPFNTSTVCNDRVEKARQWIKDNTCHCGYLPVAENNYKFCPYCGGEIEPTGNVG